MIFFHVQFRQKGIVIPDCCEGGVGQERDKAEVYDKEVSAAVEKSAERFVHDFSAS